MVTIRKIANSSGEKLDKRALKVLSDAGFIRPFRREKWRLTAKGKRAIKYHDERDAWNKEQDERSSAKLAHEGQT